MLKPARMGLYLYNNAVAVLVILLLLSACSEKAIRLTPTATTNASTTSSLLSFDQDYPDLSNATRQLVIGYLEQIEKDFAAVDLKLVTLQTEVSTFLSQTNDDNLERAKQAWLNAHSVYELTTLHRFFAMQTLGEEDSLRLLKLQYQINHWPIIPGYIDYVEDYPDSGIVNDINVELDGSGLREQHGSFDVAEATLGFHVIEFLLWGSNTETGEARPTSDYFAVEELSASQIDNGFLLEQLGSNRRRQLVTVVLESLLEDFRSSVTLWDSQLPTLKQQIESSPGSELIIMVADSMTALLAEELLIRSLYPMLNGDFKDSIQSPFSLSTQNAVSSQLSGLERLLLESQTTNGTSLDIVFSTISNEFSEFFYQNFDASKSCLVLLYSSIDSETAGTPNQMEIEIVECINLLTNMIDYLDQLKFEISNSQISRPEVF